MADPTYDKPPESPEAAPQDPNVPSARATDEEDPNRKIAKKLKAKVETASTNRRKFHPEWKRNIELRLGQIASLVPSGVMTEDEIKTEINPDWSLTKAKTANLYSQVPAVQLTHENKQYAGAVVPFAKALNYELGEKRANVGVCMEECLNDVVNAAGIGGVIVTYAARFDQVDEPNIDTKGMPPEQVQQMVATGQAQMVKVTRTIDYKFSATRISPRDLLWPAEFNGSNFDDGDWIGRRGRLNWAEAKNELGLEDDVKEKVLGGAERKSDDELRSMPEHGTGDENSVVTFSELYYWRYRFDPDCKSFKQIWKLVWVDGLPDEPAVHEQWKGQTYDEQTKKYVGSCKFPIRILTLTYITDNPVPPSDSAAGRPQVNDLRRSRQQMFQQRQRSIPIRGFDVNRVDPGIQDQLIRGDVQGMIPFNGNGANAIWEVARASYPAEDLTFDRMTKTDLQETWLLGSSQMGTSPAGEKATKAEVQTIQGNFQTRIGQERARVASFFLSIVEVMAGLMVLYSDFPMLADDEKQAMEKAWDRKHILHDLVLKIRPDSQIMLDSSQRIQRLSQALNLTAKSGYVNAKPLIVELLELHGIDTADVVKDPEPPKPDEPKINYSFKGKDDLVSPAVVAILAKSGQLPGPQEVEAAKKFLEAIQALVQAATPQAPAPGADTAPPVNPDGEHPEWTLASKVAKRSRDMGGQ